jgi:hypothetical protein
MGLNGVGGNSGGKGNAGGGISGGKSNSVGAKGNVSCSTSVKNNNATKTSTVTKSCGIQGFHGKTGIDSGKFSSFSLTKALNAKEAGKFTKGAKELVTNKFTPKSPSVKTYNVRSGVTVNSKIQAKMAELGKKVFDKTNHKITYSSGYRGPQKQATAMYNNLVKNGLKDLNKYKQKSLAKEIKDAYLANPTDKKAAIEAMTKVIENQVKNGNYISSHLRSNAVDISSVDGKYYEDIRNAVTEMGGTSLTEKDHLHVQF